MKKAYQYLYYKFYYWSYSKYGIDDLPRLTAILQVSFFILLNVITMLLVVESVTGFVLIDDLVGNKIFMLLAGLAVLIINYILLLYKRKDYWIITEFQKETENKKEQRVICIYAYIFISLISFVFAVITRF